MKQQDTLIAIEMLIEAGVPTRIIMDAIRSEFARYEAVIAAAEALAMLQDQELRSLRGLPPLPALPGDLSGAIGYDAKTDSYYTYTHKPKPTPPVTSPTPTPPLPPPKPHHSQKYDSEFLRTKLHSGWLSRKLSP